MQPATRSLRPVHAPYTRVSCVFVCRLNSCVLLCLQGFADMMNALDKVFYILYVLLSIVLLSLFVGVATDLYPKARRRSQLEWELLVTSLMQV